MTTSSNVHNTNEACCSIPPVQSDYAPKGTIKQYGSFNKVYITGPEKSETKIVCVFDIFGFFPQTQQGADIVAGALNATVYMPDFFEPDAPFPAEKFPPKTDKDKADLQAFFGGPASPPKAIEKLTTFGRFLKTDGAKTLGAYGFCWGGKVTISAGATPDPFNSVAVVHPAMLSAADAEKLTVPLAIYISKDEPIDEYDKILQIIRKKPFAAKCDHKKYANMFHGFAAARADLTKEDNRKEFEDVYAKLIRFFRNTLQS
ncbi:putative dienelactone hydrolase family protein [Lyophyllum shimeji]|uniref:Dienelactone hydrolase family protein n=1 Tax=Lyophyllum shimeji TaxID=47721 RepID=A0A9P3PJC1_LYOSH|nr:putative dienelactone hydrolase family protein [Lyophyllum shimeji]